MIQIRFLSRTANFAGSAPTVQCLPRYAETIIQRGKQKCARRKACPPDLITKLFWHWFHFDQTFHFSAPRIAEEYFWNERCCYGSE